jgi:hypothetical protein
VQYDDEIKKQFSGLDSSKFNIFCARRSIFVCGGECDPKNVIPKTYRHQLFDYTAKNYSDLHDSLVVAEDFKDYYRNGNYKDLLTFEDDIANVATLVVIILESSGALVELGLYCYREQFLDKLVVIVDEKLYANDADSFISLGPLAFIASHPKACVLSHQFPDEANMYDSDVEDLCRHLIVRLKKPSKRIFEPENNGHIAFVVAEIIRIVFPLMLNEIESCLTLMSIPIERSRLKQLLYVLEKMRIVVTVKKSDNLYYCPFARDVQFASFGKRQDGRSFVPDEVIPILKMAFIDSDDGMAHRRRRALSTYMERLNGD